ncbi:MAG TPA: MFS transporter [Actinophytocola sp.]|uniref:MFS transporter n=1 Tax=Actinophytocola sp. TaxID=1872138 RepID=UPI002DDD220A|nr:MFS transporter [Actinophytocola sp.]HEV2782311.1 MFS transporter [Actinophytocola sp.]
MSTATGLTLSSSTRARLPREVWILVAANLAIALGYALVAPALPTFARGFDVSVTAASVVVSAFAVARLLFAPMSGRLVTLLGEQRVYLAGLAIVAITTGMCALATAYWQLVTLRTLSGIGSTMFTVSAIGLMIRLTPAPLRGRASGLWGTSFLLGNVLGPLIGGGLIAISLRAPFVVYAASLLVAMAIVWLFLRHSTLAATDGEDDVPVASLRETLRHRTYVASLISSFANGWTAFGVRMALTPLFITEVLHREDAFAGTAFAVFGAGNVVMLLLSGKLSDSLGRKPIVLFGLVLAGFGTIWVGFTSSVPAFLLATVIAAFGTGLLAPPQQAAVADIIGSDTRGGQVLAVFQMTLDVGAVLGPFVAGLLADQLSFGYAFGVTGALYLLAVLPWLAARETLPRRR